MRLIVFCVLSALALCGCASSSNDYIKEGQQVNSIVVPNDVPSVKQSPYYPVPKYSGALPTKPVSLKPATLDN